MEGDGVTALLLHVGDRTLAVEIGQIEALRRKETVMPANEGPPELLGFLRLGSGLVPILDLGVCLGMEARPRPGGWLVVPYAAVAALAFRIDRIEGPLCLPWDQFALLPELLRSRQPRPIAWGVVWRDKELTPLLDLRQVVPPEEVARLLEMASARDV